MANRTLGKLLRKQMIEAKPTKVKDEEQEALNTPLSDVLVRGTNCPTAVDKGGWLRLYNQAAPSLEDKEHSTSRGSSLVELFLSEKPVTSEKLHVLLGGKAKDVTPISSSGELLDQHEQDETLCKPYIISAIHSESSSEIQQEDFVTAIEELGGNGNGWVLGEAGVDWLEGRAGDDLLRGGDQAHDVFTFNGLYGETGNDRLAGDIDFDGNFWFEESNEDEEFEDARADFSESIFSDPSECWISTNMPDGSNVVLQVDTSAAVEYLWQIAGTGIHDHHLHHSYRVISGALEQLQVGLRWKLGGYDDSRLQWRALSAQSDLFRASVDAANLVHAHALAGVCAPVLVPGLAITGAISRSVVELLTPRRNRVGSSTSEQIEDDAYFAVLDGCHAIHALTPRYPSRIPQDAFWFDAWSSEVRSAVDPVYHVMANELAHLWLDETRLNASDVAQTEALWSCVSEHARPRPLSELPFLILSSGDARYLLKTGEVNFAKGLNSPSVGIERVYGGVAARKTWEEAMDGQNVSEGPVRLMSELVRRALSFVSLGALKNGKVLSQEQRQSGKSGAVQMTIKGATRSSGVTWEKLDRLSHSVQDTEPSAQANSETATTLPNLRQFH